MRLTGIILAFIALLIIAFSASVVLGESQQNYTRTGGTDGNFNGGEGIFNSNLGVSEVTYSTRVLSDAQFHPLVADLDNDGINEIIAFDGGNVRLYHNSSLTIVDSFSIGANEISNAQIFDIDGDGLQEIIIAGQDNEVLHFLQYNNSAITNYSISYDSLPKHNTSLNGEILLHCGAANKCLMVYTECSETLAAYPNTLSCGTNSSTLYGVSFNSTDILSGTLLLLNEENITLQGGLYADTLTCFPKIRAMSYANYNSFSDTDNEYIFSAYAIRSATLGVDSQFNYWSLFYISQADETLILSLDRKLTKTFGDIFNPLGDVLSCAGNGIRWEGPINDLTAFGGISAVFTNPLVFDADLSPSNGLETVIAFMDEYDNFKMHVYSGTGTSESSAFFDDYPEASTATGQLISNPVKMNAFPEEKQADLSSDFCVLGYNNEIQEVDLNCGSIVSTWGLLNFETIEYHADVVYNVSGTYPLYNTLIHASQHDVTEFEGNNMDELINSFGVWRLNPTDTITTGCWVTSDCNMSIIFSNAKDDAVVISVDAEKVGQDDLIIQQDSNLWYADDEYENSPATISGYSVNPCLEGAWKQNTSVNVNIEVDDVDENSVGARAILYNGYDYKQDSNWSINASSGTTFSFSFVANHTVATAELLLMSRDTFTVLGETLSIPFSVAEQGLEFGDCTTDVDIGVVSEEDNETLSESDLEPNIQDNAIKNALAELDESSNLNLGLTGLWYMVMIIVGIACIWVLSGREGGKALSIGAIVASLIILEGIMLLLGAKLGFIGVGSIIVFTILILLAVIVYVKNKVIGNVSGG